MLVALDGPTFKQVVRGADRTFEMRKYQDRLKTFYPKDKPLQRCSYAVLSPPITALALDAFTVHNRNPLRWCQDLVEDGAVPTGEIICFLDRRGGCTS